MKQKRQIGLAVGITIGAHLLFAGAATTLLALRAAAPPENDNFVSATHLGSAPQLAAFGDNVYATREIGEPAHGGSVMGGSVWWRWTAPEQGAVELEVSAPDFASVVAVYRGAVFETLVESVMRKAGDAPALRFVAEAGVEYHIAVAGAEAGEIGAIDLKIRSGSGREPPQPETELVMLLPDMFTVEEKDDEDRLRFAKTDHNEPSESAPERARFESDRNTLAASEQPPDTDGEPDMPSVDGEELPFGELAESEFVDSELDDRTLLPVAPQWRNPAPAPQPQPAERTDAEAQLERLEDLPSPPVDDGAGEDRQPAAALAPLEVPSVLEEPADDPSAENFASRLAEEALEGSAEPLPEPIVPGDQAFEPRPASSAAPAEKPVESEPPSPPTDSALEKPGVSPPAFRPEDPKRRLSGTLSNLGKAARDVAATPLGEYKRRVNRAVERSWRRQYVDHADLASYGTLRISCTIDRRGKVVDMRIAEKNCNATVLSFSIAGVRGASIPPMPAEVHGGRPDARVVFDFNIIIY